MKIKIPASAYTAFFWNSWQLDPTRNDYNIVFDQTIKGKLDIKKLSDALNNLVANHFLLNSHLNEKDCQLYWERNEKIEALHVFKSIRFEDEFVKDKFDLEKGALYRFGIFKKSHNEYDFIIVIHHVLIGGLSFSKFINLISSYYNNEINESEILLNEQISNIISMNEMLTKKISHIKKYIAKQYWQKRLEGLPQKNEFYYISNLDQGNKKIGEYYFTIEKSNVASKFINKYGTTWFTVLSSLWGLLIAKYCNTDHAFIGYPIVIKEARKFIYGCQINTALLPINLNNTITILELIEQANAHIKSYKINEEYRYSYLPVHEILESSSIKTLNVLVAQTDLKNKTLNFNGCKANVNQRFNMDISGSELILEYEETEDYLNCRVRYLKKIFYENHIVRMVGQFKYLFNQAINCSKKIIAKLSVLTPQEYQQIVIDWNQTDKEYPKDKTIQQLFEEQVSKSPDHIAVVFEDQQLTYEELNQKANQLAHYIRKIYLKTIGNELKPDTLIALCLDRSLEMIIAILATLKAGGAYVPMDPSYPNERIRYMLEDTGTKILLTQSHLQQSITEISAIQSEHLSNRCLQVIILDRMPYRKELLENLSQLNCSTDLAYVIYTSGTTGLPKGTLTTHKPLVNRLLWMQEAYGFNDRDKILQKTPYIFDVSVWELLLPILSGSQLIFAKPEGHKDSSYLHELIHSKGITKLHFVPSMLQAYLGNIEGLSSRQHSPLTDVFCSGETLPPKLSWKFKYIYTDVKLHNLYGPTEVAIDVSSYNDIQGDESIIPIGKPIQNIKFYILDVNLNPVPVGAIGELYIRGAGIARGYLKRTDLTDATFVENIFATAKDNQLGRTRLYKTGDLVRWLPDGNLEYIGRNDFQVKIRGYRIELGEIENTLSQLPEIKQVVVLAMEKQTGETQSNYLVAYYVSDQVVKDEDFIAHLSEFLPDYMIPALFIKLDSMPITVNGKIDRTALPEPDFTSKQAYVAPRTDGERILEIIWENLLGIKKISIDDDFFALGGSSLAAISLINKINKSFPGNNSSVSFIFYNNTIRKQSDSLKKYMFNINNNHAERQLKYISKLNNCDKEKVFLIHPLGAGAEVYKEFSHLLEDVYSVYGVQSHNFDYPNNRIHSIEGLSRLYISYIKNIQNNGSYILGGHSLGGTIAFEICKQLQSQGYEINHLFILDTWVFHDLEKHHMSLLTPLTIERIRRRDDFEKLSDVEKNNLISLQQLEAKIAIDYNISFVDIQATLFKANSFDRHFNFAIPYKMKQSIKLLETIYRNKNDNGWRDYVRELEVIDMNCTHTEIMELNQLELIVKHMRKLNASI